MYPSLVNSTEHYPSLLIFHVSPDSCGHPHSRSLSRPVTSLPKSLRVFHGRSVYPLGLYLFLLPLFLPLPEQRAVGASLSRPRCFLLSPRDRFLGSCLLSLLSHASHRPSPPLWPFSFSPCFILSPPPAVRTYANAAISSSQCAHTHRSPVNVCACRRMAERTRAATHARGTTSFSGPYDMRGQAKRVFPLFSPGKRCIVSVHCNGNYVKGWRVSTDLLNTARNFFFNTDHVYVIFRPRESTRFSWKRSENRVAGENFRVGTLNETYARCASLTL